MNIKEKLIDLCRDRTISFSSIFATACITEAYNYTVCINNSKLLSKSLKCLNDKIKDMPYKFQKIFSKFQSSLSRSEWSIELSFKLIQYIPRSLLEISIYKINFNLPGLGSIFGAALTAVIEIGIAAHTIYEAKQKWNEGTLISSREEFIKEIIDAIVLALSRSGASIGGMIIGQCFIPIPFVGSFVGLLVGTLVGHIFGKGISQSCSSYLASAVDKLTEGNTAGAGTKVD